MGHTPGPWVVREPEDGELHEIYAEHGGDLICYPVFTHNQRANVPLIAAAPDLLAACHAVAHDLQAALDGDDFSGMPDAELFRAFLNVLRPAIAKAEGTPPPKGDT